MRCEQCQTEIDAASKTCPECGHSVTRVEIMTPEEREDFQGITIEDPGREGERRDNYSYEYSDPQKGVYVREFKFNNVKGGLLGRLIVGLIIAGLLFLAFPVLFVFLTFVIMWGILSVLLRRR